VGNLRDRWNGAALEKGHWFDSDLCILEPVNSMQMVVFELLKITGLLCSRYSATVQKGRRFFALAGKDMELPNGKGGKRKTASKRQQAASPAAPALVGGSPVEGEMAKETLAVPGPSGVGAGASGSAPPVPADESAAAAEKAAAGPPTASPVMEPAMQSSASAMECVAAVEPAAATAAVSATAPAAAQGERPVLANVPVAASKECWVLNPGIGPKVIVRRISSGPAAAAAEAAAIEDKCAGELVPRPGLPPAARRAAAETESPPTVTAPKPVAPAAAAAPGKRKAKAGVTGGSQKRKKSSPVKIKDL
jgi:hypothetical protein